MAFTRFTKNVLNVSALPDRVQNQAQALKATFDQAGVDIKEALNALIAELETSTSASNIGANVGSVATKTVQAILTSFEGAIANRYTKLEAETLLASGTNNLVADIDVNLTTGVITVTKKDGSIETFDTAIEKVPAKFEIVESDGTYALKVTNLDGSTTQTDVTNLMNIYTFDNSDYITFETTGEGNEKTVTASIKANSIGLDKLSLSVVSTIEGYMTSARDSANAAKASETNARTSELNALEAENTATNAAASASASAQTATNASKAVQEVAEEVTSTAQTAKNEITSAVNTAKNELNATATQAKAETNSNALLAKSYAVGGTGTRAGEDADNAKYYSEQAKATVSGDYVTRPEFQEGIKDLASKTYVDTAIENIDIPEVDFTGYATETYVNTTVSNAVSSKTDKTYVDAQVATKVDATYVNNAVSPKADKTYVDGQLSTANTLIANKADTSYVNTELAKKADTSTVNTALAGKADTSHTQGAETITAGTFKGRVLANATEVTVLTNSQVRNIKAQTDDLTAGTSTLATGDIVFVYE